MEKFLGDKLMGPFPSFGFNSSIMTCLAVFGAIGLWGGCEPSPVPQVNHFQVTEDSGGLDSEVGNTGEAGPVCVPSRQSIEHCDYIDNDCNGVVDDVAESILARDPRNCGKCFNICDLPHAQSDCVDGQCVRLSCEEGYSDLDGDPSNGCEEPCVMSNGGVEACDGRDNDCDHEVDEDFNLAADVEHCGACNRPCRLPNVVEHECVEGVCVPVLCADSFYDLDGDPSNGCEYGCVPIDGDAQELCNGLDDDCDGEVDENLGPPNIACRPFGVCADTEPICDGINGWVCRYDDPRYNQFEDPCDGYDNDCDGETDEDFPEKGEPCHAGDGLCRRSGRWVCTDDGHALRCDAHAAPDAAVPEVCNGIDDDCDGIVDNHLTDLDWVQVGDFRIYRYEASRPDATADDGGVLNGRACSKKGVMPWGDITYEDAAQACALGGWRLCTEDEWRLACGGPGDTVFPYGNDYVPGRCNDISSSLAQVVVGGLLEECVSGYGVFDMSGNVKEWVAVAREVSGNGSGNEIDHHVLGGAYDNDVPSSLSCRSEKIPRTEGFKFANVGFRCCWP